MCDRPVVTEQHLLRSFQPRELSGDGCVSLLGVLPHCRNVHDITLSYTFFKVDQDDEETAEADSVGSGIKLHGPGQLPAGVAAPPLPAALVTTPAAVPLAAPAAGGT